MDGGATRTQLRTVASTLVDDGAHVPFESFITLALQLVPTRALALTAAEELEQRSTRRHDDCGLTARRLRLALLTGLFSD